MWSYLHVNGGPATDRFSPIDGAVQLRQSGSDPHTAAGILAKGRAHKTKTTKRDELGQRARAKIQLGVDVSEPHETIKRQGTKGGERGQECS